MKATVLKYVIFHRLLVAPVSESISSNPVSKMHDDAIIICIDRFKPRRIFNNAFEKADVIITPTTGIPAPPIPEKALPHGDSDLSTLIEIMRFVTPGNLTGLPTISFPVGYNEKNLPIGMQAIGKAWDEETLFRMALASEQFVKRQAPEVFYKML